MDSLTSVLLFPEPLKVIMALGFVLEPFFWLYWGRADAFIEVTPLEAVPLPEVQIV